MLPVGPRRAILQRLATGRRGCLLVKTRLRRLNSAATRSAPCCFADISRTGLAAERREVDLGGPAGGAGAIVDDSPARSPSRQRGGGGCFARAPAAGAGHVERHDAAVATGTANRASGLIFGFNA